ncbi:MAG: 4Fe-4S binding protein [Desulfitobacterium sp.]|nr:4Fe-4S binding protein [Desulfitobacterium sp.]
MNKNLSSNKKGIFIGRKNLLIILACISLLLAAIYQQFSNKEDILSLLQQGEPAAVEFQEISGVYKTYELRDENGNFLSYGVMTSASGYGGPIKMLTFVDQEGFIANALLLEDSETPLYLKRVLAAGYPENLQGKVVTEPLVDQEGIDAVSGATRTVEGITLAVEKGMYQIGQNQLGLTVPTLKTFYFQWQDGLVILLLVIAILAATLKKSKLRPWILVATVFILGFMENNSLTIGNYMSILALKMPTFFERPIWYVMVIGIFFVTLLLGRNIYCSWLCPFGAIQEGIYKSLNLVDYKANPKLIQTARKNRWFFLWLAALLALLFNNPGIASFEPFSVFFDGDGNTSQWIMMGLILLFSIFLLRFWCRIFCPVGTFLDFLAVCKRKFKRFFRKKDEASGKPAVASCQRTTLMDKEKCTSCSKGKPEEVQLSGGDKIVAVGIFIIWALILGALIQNLGLF